MSDKTGNDTPFLLLASAGAIVAVALLAAVAMALDEEEAGNHVDLTWEAATATIVTDLMAGRSKRGIIADKEGLDKIRKFTYCYRDRAATCIQQDFLGSQPSFGPNDFKRIFRISQSIYDWIHNYLCGCNSFFKDGFEVIKQIKISSHKKVLITLKYLSYGCSVNSFQNYFQVGESQFWLYVRLT
jgi:hypothetical protein